MVQSQSMDELSNCVVKTLGPKHCEALQLQKAWSGYKTTDCKAIA